ncbi:hypothetical protein F5146DRAFT_1144072 [Armillaria mellea]|nr:hypothetical protein F5146DRAFT_1144072 [Armillaria mellea]
MDALVDETVSLPAHTLLSRYTEIERSVDSLLNVALGDPHRLQLQLNSIALYEASLERLHHTLPEEQALTIRGNLLTFKRLLREAALRSSDPPHYPPVLIPRETKPLAGRGRPAASVDPQLLKDLTSNYGGTVKIGRLLGFSARTIRRLQLKLNLVPDGQASFQSHVTEDRTEYWTHHVARPRMSDLSDEELDAIVREILTDYPRLGHTMLCDAIARCGLRVSQERAKNTPTVFPVRILYGTMTETITDTPALSPDSGCRVITGKAPV